MTKFRSYHNQQQQQQQRQVHTDGKRKRVESAAHSSPVPSPSPSFPPHAAKSMHKLPRCPADPHFTAKRIKPREWPDGVIFSNTLDWGVCAREVVAVPSRQPVKIVVIDDESHPAYTQRGLFARRKINKGYLMDYTGVICTHRSRQAHGNDYTVRVQSIQHKSLFIDASTHGNESRFINDFRGVARRPNVELQAYWCPRTGEKRVAVMVLACIPASAELLLDYGDEYWQECDDDDDDDDEEEEEEEEGNSGRKILCFI